ncbi:hypothetical protein FFLO_06563 [Filobasidium floriforme]|uniref:Core domain-containing protein n=1 Tax=Filobasidium floriforme TaxID=5210 RepID=A0A8K0NKG3_9TREE|nr:hypothetical protein FFLO_06563 [Filobasidium floriforme]
MALEKMQIRMGGSASTSTSSTPTSTSTPNRNLSNTATASASGTGNESESENGYVEIDQPTIPRSTRPSLTPTSIPASSSSTNPTPTPGSSAKSTSTSTEIPSAKTSTSTGTTTGTTGTPARKAGRTIGLKGKKNAITLTPSAISRLAELADPAASSSASDSTQDSAAPQLLRISVRNRGCAGLAYHLSYLPLDAVNRFDEIVEQDGVKVLIDSRALFSVVGSEMDWVEDRMSARFVFKNPNVKDACGCGESFHV